MNDATVQNHNGPAFNHLNDPNTGANMLDPTNFMPNPNAFDAAHFQNQQLPPRMQNGGMRNPSPAFNNPVYQTNSVVPSKRPRPRDESMVVTSPRQALGMLPHSRSHTPQQNTFPPFPANNQPPQHVSQPTPYSHLQHNGSANASPSPIMANQLRPGVVPQRVSTASPHPFSPAAQQFAVQASPSPSDHGNRVDTPQNLYNPNFGPPYNQAFTPPPGRTAPTQGPMPTSQIPPQQMQQPSMYHQQSHQQPRPSPAEQQKMLYHMQLQQQLHQRTRMQGLQQNPSPMAKPQIQVTNGQFPHSIRPQQPIARPNNPEQFIKQLTTFMQSRGLTLDLNPIVGDRQVNLVMLYIAVTKFGGYRRVNQGELWAQVAQMLQFNPMQNPNIPQQIKIHYERNLAMFEEAYNAQHQRQKIMTQQTTGVGMGGPHPQMSPTKQIAPQGQHQSPQYMPQVQQGHLIQQQQQQHPLQSQHQPSTPVKQMTPINPSQQPTVNGFSAPPMAPQQQHHPPIAQAHSRNSLSRTVETASCQNGSAFSGASQASAKSAVSSSLQSQHAESSTQADPSKATAEFEMSETYDPLVRTLNTWGGFMPDESLAPDLVKTLYIDLPRLKPNVPTLMELGTIDIHALTMSLQSGIHSEVRLALDTLATISVELGRPIDLKMCDDLVESIIDCAEVQVELLAENTAEVSDVMLISSYEDVVRGCRIEREGLLDIPVFGTIDYELDRAVEKLICITTILRNLSFFETNHPLLADELVIKFLCVVIRYLGTRNMLLRTNCNTLDFMKDVIIFLSNLAQTIEVPGKEQALCLLHFLLAFAPCPPPTVPGSERVIFSPYDPAVHRYLPPAVDSLAKLLARDEPNRTFYKSIFTSDASSSPQFDLLTKSFALAISPVPSLKPDEPRINMPKILEARKPLLMQGMLAAEILSHLVPGFETKVSKSWLNSEDGFAQSLMRLICILSSEGPAPQSSRGNLNSHRPGEEEALVHITLSGLAVLRRLYERARNPDDPNSAAPNEAMIKPEILLGALLRKQPRPEILRQLCLYAELDR